MLAEVAAVAGASHDPRVLPFALALLSISIALYSRWIGPLRSEGGRVAQGHFGPVDLVVSLLLGTYFIATAWVNFRAPSKGKEITLNLLVASTVLELLLIAFLCGILAIRRKNLSQLFGLRAVPPLQIFGRAALFLLAALPGVIALTGLFSLFNPDPEEQEIVMFFRDHVKHLDLPAVIAVVVTACLVAPMVEELVFRGYLYPTLKRYLGPVASAILVSALFAAVHANLSSSLGLFALALCLTAVYEKTGSLLVSMAMHAFFNTLSLVIMGWQMTHSAP